MTMDYKKSVLWTIVGFGEETVPEGKKYWCDNRDNPHDDVIILHYPTEDEIVLRTPEEELPVKEGQLLICRHGENSSYGKLNPHERYACKWVALSGAGLAEHYEALKAQHGPVLLFGKTHPLLKGIDRLCSMINPKEPAEPVVLAGAIHRLIMSLFAHAESGFCATLSPVNLAIHQLVSAPLHPWNIKELAAQCGCSREHLTREFSVKYGQSPQEYLLKHRTERALYLLQHTALVLPIVASQSGFSNAASLARQIRIVTGQSPQKLRPAYKKGKSPKGKFKGLYNE